MPVLLFGLSEKLSNSICQRGHIVIQSFVCVLLA